MSDKLKEAVKEFFEENNCISSAQLNLGEFIIILQKNVISKE